MSRRYYYLTTRIQYAAPTCEHAHGAIETSRLLVSTHLVSSHLIFSIEARRTQASAGSQWGSGVSVAQHPPAAPRLQYQARVYQAGALCNVKHGRRSHSTFDKDACTRLIALIAGVQHMWTQRTPHAHVPIYIFIPLSVRVVRLSSVVCLRRLQLLIVTVHAPFSAEAVLHSFLCLPVP